MFVILLQRYKILLISASFYAKKSIIHRKNMRKNHLFEA